MPTELNGDVAQALRERGLEFGTTTGRARRIGWLDLSLLRRAVRVNGVDGICLTNLDDLIPRSGVGPANCGWVGKRRRRPRGRSWRLRGSRCGFLQRIRPIRPTIAHNRR